MHGDYSANVRAAQGVVAAGGARRRAAPLRGKQSALHHPQAAPRGTARRCAADAAGRYRRAHARYADPEAGGHYHNGPGMTAYRRSSRARQGYGTASRRRVLLGLCAGLATARSSLATTPLDAVSEELMRLERQTGGRIGLAACSTASGARIAHRADERFAMCSTFKLLLAAAILAEVDAARLRLDQVIRYSRDSLLANSPVTTAHVDEGALSLEEMARSVVEESDNTAANQLLALIGGPSGYTRFVRALGDRVTRLDRVELALNSNLPHDVRDTTTP